MGKKFYLERVAYIDHVCVDIRNFVWSSERTAMTDINTKHSEQAQAIPPEQAIVNKYTIIAVTFATIFSFFYFSAGSQYKLLGYIHVVAITLVLGNYGALQLTKNFRLATAVLLGIGVVFVLALFVTGGWHDTGYLWIFAYLPFAFFLSKKKAAWIWAAAMHVGILLAAIGSAFGIIAVPYSTELFMNVYASFLLCTICMGLYHQAHIRYQESAEENARSIFQKNLELDTEIKERKETEQKLLARTEELNTTSRFMVNRELRMIELKDEIKKLEEKLSQLSLN